MFHISKKRETADFIILPSMHKKTDVSKCGRSRELSISRHLQSSKHMLRLNIQRPRLEPSRYAVLGVEYQWINSADREVSNQTAPMRRLFRVFACPTRQNEGSQETGKS